MPSTEGNVPMGRRGWPLGRARTEERRAVDAPVEARPGLTVGEFLLEPVEAAELAAQVVDRVHQGCLARGGDDRRAMLELAVVGQDDVEDRLGQVWIEAVDALDLAAHLVVAAGNLTLQAP